jgi:HEAT repeat protein
LAEALKDPKVSVRSSAAEAIGVLGWAPPGAQHILLSALRDESIAVRRSAAGAVSRLQIDDDDAVPKLMVALDDEDDVVRQLAADGLGNQGERATAALPKLVEMLASPSAGVRRAVATALGKIGPDASIVLEALFGVTRDRDPSVRARVIWALGVAGSPRSAPFLIGGLSDSNEEVRRMAIESLGRHKELAAEAVPRLAFALGDRDEEIRAQAAWALGNSASARGVPALVKALQDDSAIVRKSAIVALAQLGNEALDAVPALVQTAHDSDVEVRRTAAAAMRSFSSPHIIPALKELLDDQDAGVRKSAIDTLSSLNADVFDLLPTLSEAMSNSDPYVRRQVAAAMGRSGSGGAGVHLAKALEDPDLEVQTAAIEALSSLGPSATHAVDQLVRSLQSQHVEIRRAAAAALGAIGSARAIPGLVESLGDDDADVVLKALYSLSYFPEIPVELGRSAIGHLKDADSRFRSAAVAILYQLGSLAAEAAPILAEWLRDPDPNTRADAAYAFGYLSTAAGSLDSALKYALRKHAEALKTALRDDQEWVREAALGALVQLANQGVFEQVEIWPLVVAALEDPSASVRASAAVYLGSAKGSQATERAIGPLVRTLQDRSSWVRQTAIGSLGSLGKGALSAVPELIAALQDLDAMVRMATARALGSIGSNEAVGPLASALEDGSVHVRTEAAAALASIGPASSSAVPALGRALQDRQSQVRSAAAQALAAIGPSATHALSSVIQALDDARPEVRMSVVGAIGAIGSPKALPSLVPLLRDPSIEVRLKAIEVFSTIGSVADIRELVPLLDDEEEQVRIAVAAALGALGSAEAVESLSAALKDSNAGVRAAAAASLAEIGSKDAVLALVASLKDGDAGVRTRAADALGRIRSHEPTAVAGLLEALSDPEPEVRLTAVSALPAVSALGELGKRRDFPDVLGLLSDTSHDVRRGTAESIDQLAQDALVNNDLEAIDPIFAAAKAMEETKDKEILQYVGGIKAAGQALRDRAWAVRIKNAKIWAETHWEIASIIAIIAIWVPFCYFVYFIFPLHFLSAALALQSLRSPILGRFGGPSVSLHWLILGGLWQRPRILDAWVRNHIGKARQAFETKRTVSDRSIHITMPVELNRETIAELQGAHLQETFDQNPGCLLIWGEGGSGKTSLACQIGRAAMSKDPTERPAGHLMLPVLIERELDFVSAGAGDPFTEAVRGDLQRLVDKPVPVELVRMLLQRRRILVIIDHLSELSEETRNRVRPDVPDFPAAALIVTSRLEERLGDVSRSVLRPLKVTGDFLFEFLSAYLRHRGVRDQFPDQEFAWAAGRIAELVGDRETTVLLVKLYADQLILSKGGTNDDVLPDNIPDLMLCYLNNINASVPDDVRRDPKSVHRDAQAVAWACIERTFRPGHASIEDEIVPVLQAVESDAVTDAAERLRYLEKRLSLVETLEPGYKARFILDPLTEYLAGLHLVSIFANDDSAWRRFIIDAQAKTTEEGTIGGFLLAIRDCCLNRELGARVPEFVVPELERLTARDRSQPIAA